MESCDQVQNSLRDTLPARGIQHRPVSLKGKTSGFFFWINTSPRMVEVPLYTGSLCIEAHPFLDVVGMTPPHSPLADESPGLCPLRLKTFLPIFRPIVIRCWNRVLEASKPLFFKGFLYRYSFQYQRFDIA